MKIKLPADPALAAFDEKQTELKKLRREIGEVTQKKERAREEFLLAQNDRDHALLDAEGRDLSLAAFQKIQRDSDEREAMFRRQVKTLEAEIAVIERERAKAINAANRADYVAMLRKRARVLIAVAKLNDEERAFHDGMRDLGVSGSLRPMAVGPVGNWSDSQSVARFHIAELREHFPELTNENFEG